jgi:hypothetical protein
MQLDVRMNNRYIVTKSARRVPISACLSVLNSRSKPMRPTPNAVGLLIIWMVYGASCLQGLVSWFSVVDDFCTCFFADVCLRQLHRGAGVNGNCDGQSKKIWISKRIELYRSGRLIRVWVSVCGCRLLSIRSTIGLPIQIKTSYELIHR